MLILLPPSERKLPARRGRPLDLAGLSGAAHLTPARERVLAALAATSARPDAAGLLGVGAGAGEEVAANTRWCSEPAQRVDRLYTGVLYDALGLADLPPAAGRRARAAVRIVSAAHGLLRLTDAVPAYRLAMGAALPDLQAGPGGPGLAGFWRAHLPAVLDAELAAGHAVLDLRSAAYAAAWTPPPQAAGQVVTTRVLTVRAGREVVVSHAAKHTRGLLARHLLTRDAAPPRSADALVAALAEAFAVRERTSRAGAPRTVEVLLPEEG